MTDGMQRFVAGRLGARRREGWPRRPVPHAHCYNPERDQAERDILRVFAWDRAPLRPEDEQLRDSR